MPSPAVLADYEAVLPGSADRIVGAFEAVTTKASQRDDRITDATIWIRKSGLGWAVFFLLLLFVSGIVFFAVGKTTAGLACMSPPALVAVTSVITGAMKKD